MNILFLLFAFFVKAQTHSALILGEKKQKISFKLINNLIILPLDVNDVRGNFILDTGVKGNIIFLTEEKDFITNDSLKKIYLKGFGYGTPLEAFVSTGNTISFKNLRIEDKEFYLLKDEELNFSAKTGMTINGIIGADFFRNNIVKVDYKKRKVFVYDSNYYYKEKHIGKKVDSIGLVFHSDKPYMEGSVKLFPDNDERTHVKLLIDTGGTDALWLFKDENKFQNLPENSFTDFIGESLTGSLHGDKTRIEDFSFGKFSFGNPIVSFLDEDVSENARKIQGRNGTLGADILKRFTVWFDYGNQKLFLKKNSDFGKDFYYNMSGLEINYNGSVMTLEFSTRSYSSVNSENSRVVFSYKYVLKPSYVIANVRKGSPGHLSGLMEGDVLLEINNSSVQEKSYGDIVEHFYTKKNKMIELLVKRSEEKMRFKFKLIDELDK